MINIVNDIASNSKLSEAIENWGEQWKVSNAENTYIYSCMYSYCELRPST